jgi:hypothetical protein
MIVRGSFMLKSICATASILTFGVAAIDSSSAAETVPAVAPAAADYANAAVWLCAYSGSSWSRFPGHRGQRFKPIVNTVLD